MKSDSFLQRVLHMWPVKILSVAAAILLYFFTSLLALGTRSVDLPIRYILPGNYTQASDYPTRARVIIRGNSEKIFSISEADLLVSADFSSHSAEGDFLANLKMKRVGLATEIQPLEITLEPNSVQVSLEKSEFKDVPVEVKFTGSPKAGFSLNSWSLALSNVRISGPRSRLATITMVQTEDLDLSAKTSDFTQRLHVRSPDSLVKIQNSEAIDCKIEIRESPDLGAYSGISIMVVGLDQSLTVVRRMQTGMIKTQNPKNGSDPLRVEDLRMIVDASSIKAPGKYQLKVIPEVPSGVVILGFEPETTEIVVGGDFHSSDKP